ncbi:reticulon-4-interacting protein 1, mitochondrial-like isoform X2 [Gigantopelta aegis]|uniref:reticulon-4-interacting protein 1, mitochondrial-like isoform X2 n=1 Tax=Gigantopelta aegis TaxID=1735272 RepID=UPI001B88A260|nr:reticulon-4-interacting protein 1, mitochondrial-like isoform X2 [Gigantopelta aegis]
MSTLCRFCARKLRRNVFKASLHRIMFPSLLHRNRFTTDTSSVLSEMSAWQIHQYGGNEELSLSTTSRVPYIDHPNDIVVKVHAASVNPIDVHMRSGYGQVAINLLRKQCGRLRTGSEFPLILGRDFAGVVMETGQNVKTLTVGDEVWGALGAHRQGTHAQYTITSETEVSKKPESLSHVQAAAVPYVAATVWAALCSVGGLRENSTTGKRVFITAGSGGVGSFAIQLLKTWGADVTTTCSTDAVNFVRELGASVVIDYKTQNVFDELNNLKGFDFVFDTLGGDASVYADILKKWGNATYVSIKPPLLLNTDKLGLVGGVLKTVGSLGCNALQGFCDGRNIRWALFMPNGKALGKVAKLVEQGHINPVVEKVFTFEEVPSAFEKVANGHARGKTVIQIL